MGWVKVFYEDLREDLSDVYDDVYHYLKTWWGGLGREQRGEAVARSVFVISDEHEADKK